MNTTGANNTAVGQQSLYLNTIGAGNTAVGQIALTVNTTGSSNVAIGLSSLTKNTTGGSNVAIGSSSLAANTTGSSNTAVGTSSLYSNSGQFNVAVGQRSLYNNSTGSNNTAVGCDALNDNILFENTTGIGFNAQVSGSNQIQLGNPGTSVYAYGAVQNRSDMRDKADVRDTRLGLNFICGLRPVDYRWDLRDDYRLVSSETGSPEPSAAAIQSKTSDYVHDGTHKRSRYHHGLIAQEVKAAVESLGDESVSDFGGYQDHTIAGGDNVLSLGYSEFIAPLIKAVQELKAMVQGLQERVRELELKA